MAKSIGVTPAAPTERGVGQVIGGHGQFSPLDLDCRNWWAADLSLPGALNGDLIATMPDLSGNSVPYTATGAACPTLVTSVKNALPALQFDGVAQWMRCTSIGGYRSYPMTMFLVAKNSVADDNAEHWSFGTQIGSDTFINFDWIQNKFTFTGGLIHTTAMDTSWHIVVFQANTASDKIIARIDGVEVTGNLGAGLNTAPFGCDIGSRAGAGRFFNGFMGEGGVIAGALSNYDHKRLERYLSLRWDIQVS